MENPIMPQKFFEIEKPLKKFVSTRSGKGILICIGILLFISSTIIPTITIMSSFSSAPIIYPQHILYTAKHNASLLKTVDDTVDLVRINDHKIYFVKDDVHVCFGKTLEDSYLPGLDQHFKISVPVTYLAEYNKYVYIVLPECITTEIMMAFSYYNNTKHCRIKIQNEFIPTFTVVDGTCTRVDTTKDHLIRFLRESKKSNPQARDRVMISAFWESDIILPQYVSFVNEEISSSFSASKGLTKRFLNTIHTQN